MGAHVETLVDMEMFLDEMKKYGKPISEEDINRNYILREYKHRLNRMLEEGYIRKTEGIGWKGLILGRVTKYELTGKEPSREEAKEKDQHEAMEEIRWILKYSYVPMTIEEMMEGSNKLFIDGEKEVRQCLRLLGDEVIRVTKKGKSYYFLASRKSEFSSGNWRVR